MSSDALVIDRDREFADKLRGWLAACGLEVAIWSEWNDGLDLAPEPRLVFIDAEPSEEAAFAWSERTRAVWPRAQVVFTLGKVPRDERDLGGWASVDKQTLTQEGLQATVAALIGPLPDRGSAPGQRGERPDASSSRVVEFEEEVRRLREELDEARRAAQAVGLSRDFLGLSAVVGSKEKEIVRLRKEISARDHKLANSQRGAREAGARALIATRERDAALAHEAQLQRDLEAEQAEVRRLRAEIQRQAEETERALASLRDERRQHDETRREREAGQALQAGALRRFKEDEAGRRSTLEAQLREEKDQAVAGTVATWRARLKRLRRKYARGRATHRQELAASQAAAANQSAELQRLHEQSLSEVLAAHAEAERRAEQERVDRGAAEARLVEEKAHAVGAVAAEWEAKLEELRRAHAASSEALSRHFQEQLGELQGSRERERARREAESAEALQRSAQELAAARADAARLEHEMRQRYEEELLQVRARGLETLAGVEARLQEEKAQALAAAQAEWEARLDAERRAHAASLEALRRQAADELAGAQARAARIEPELREGFEQESARAAARHLESLTSLEVRLRAEKDEAVAATVTLWEGKLEELRQAQATSLDALGRQYREELASLQASHRQVFTERDAAHEAALARAAQERAAERAELQGLQERSLKEALDGHFESERRERLEHQAAQASLEERLRREAADAVAASGAEWQGRLDELRRDHAGGLESLRQGFHDELAQLRASGAEGLVEREAAHQAALRRTADALAAARLDAVRLEQETGERHEREIVRLESEHAQALTALETSLRAEADEAVAAAVTAWQSRLEELRGAHAAALSGLRSEHLDRIADERTAFEQELARRDEAHEVELRRVHEELAAARRKATPPGPSHVLARQADALSALEARLTEEKEQAVAATVAEWKAKVERLRRGHADALAALRHEHEEQLLALEAARQERPAAPPAAEAGGRVVPLKAVNRDRSG